MPTARTPSRTSIPSQRRSCSARAESFSGNVFSTRRLESSSTIRACEVSTDRYSDCRSRCESSASCPAISTPVGPAPTIANVIQASRSGSVSAASASSNAPRIIERNRLASSTDFIPGASTAQSSRPK